MNHLSFSWISDPLYCGTYSYMSVGSKHPEDIHTLAEPLYSADGRARVLFAGEATSVRAYSTVHGARESGLREAGRVLALKKE